MAAVFPVTALAQVDVEKIVQDARQADLEGRPAFGGLSEVGDLRRDWSVNTFYVVYRGAPPEQTVFWAVRRETGTRMARTATVWADSRSCPGVRTMLLAMEQLPAVRPDAIRLGEEASAEIQLHGSRVTFWNRWARSGPENAAVDVEIVGNVNSPAARWWAESSPGLADCWTPNPPA